jgi:hypothetical protein
VLARGETGRGIDVLLVVRDARALVVENPHAGDCPGGPAIRKLVEEYDTMLTSP